MTLDPAVAPQLVNDSNVITAPERNASVTLDPAVALQLVNDSNVITAPERNVAH